KTFGARSSTRASDSSASAISGGVAPGWSRSLPRGQRRARSRGPHDERGVATWKRYEPEHDRTSVPRRCRAVPVPRWTLQGAHGPPASDARFTSRHGGPSRIARVGASRSEPPEVRTGWAVRPRALSDEHAEDLDEEVGADDGGARPRIVFGRPNHGAR